MEISVIKVRNLQIPCFVTLKDAVRIKLSYGDIKFLSFLKRVVEEFLEKIGPTVDRIFQFFFSDFALTIIFKCITTTYFAADVILARCNSLEKTAISRNATEMDLN